MRQRDGIRILTPIGWDLQDVTCMQQALFAVRDTVYFEG